MNITTKQFQILSDINLVWNFLVETYDWKNASGRPAPFFEYAITTMPHFNGEQQFVFSDGQQFLKDAAAKRGLAAAALTQHYRTLKPLGATHMTGGDDEFYKKIGYGKGYHWTIWKKE